MAKVYDFEQARREKESPPPYITPDFIEIPEGIRKKLDEQRAITRRQLLRIAQPLIEVGDVPMVRQDNVVHSTPSETDPPPQV